ncbi:VTT domain-containing protein [Polycyclovorans algicola]|uniref:VTT domain-containing protein n=1 Tax=Polycyclovorans algicola TaxID=616992 RepID=UPI0004A6B9F0|nr:VTT domain-containing protein [Polycyclovorans algicola]
MTELVQSFLAWTEAHPGWALLVLYLAALLDAVFMIGVFVPAGLVLFSVGALVALDVLPLWTTIVVAAAGGVSGDSISFWVGHRFGRPLFDHPWMQRRRKIIERAQTFFDQHGGKGIFLARFLGPLRAILPTVAGASGMRWGLFLAADTVAALGWAIAFILPGVVFGASLGLAAEVAGRLALMLVCIALLSWGTVVLTRLGLLSASVYAERWAGWLLDASRRYRRLGLFGAKLADPQQPETPVLMLMAVVLGAVGGLALYLVGSPALHEYPWPTDATVFQGLRELHSAYGLSVASLFLHLGEWPVYVPVATAVLVSLVVQKKMRAAAHWVAAVGFGWALSLGMTLIPTLPAPFVYFDLPAPPGYSERDLVLAIIIYAFLPVVLTTRQPLQQRGFDYGWAGIIIVLIIAARLYVGAQWWSHALIDLGIALIWAALLGLGLRRHRPVRILRGETLLVAAITLVAATSLQWAADLQRRTEQALTPPRVTLTQWETTGYQAFPTLRQDIAGRPRQPFNLQWSGALADIEAQLRADGWSPPPSAASSDVLRWLSNPEDVGELPVLPQIHAGERELLRLRRPVSGDLNQQLLLRLWASGAKRSDGQPVWIGSLVLQESRAVYGGLMHYPLAVAAYSPGRAFAFANPRYRPDYGIHLLSTPAVGEPSP